jgi:toxin ParE1/3/4
MTYSVNILEQAEQDIKDIYYYVAYTDSKEKALTLIGELERTCFKLESFPERGIVPHELNEIGVIDYVQVLCFNYRIIYQIEQQQVFIHAVLDGRRDMPSLLERRFLRRSN